MLVTYSNCLLRYSFRFPITYSLWRPVSCRATSSQSSVQWPFRSQTNGVVALLFSSIATNNEPLKPPNRYREKRICTDKHNFRKKFNTGKIFSWRKASQGHYRYIKQLFIYITDLAGISGDWRRERRAPNGRFLKGITLSHLQKQEVPCGVHNTFENKKFIPYNGLPRKQYQTYMNSLWCSCDLTHTLGLSSNRWKQLVAKG